MVSKWKGIGLSGNVRAKLAIARAAAKENPQFAVNAEKLEQVQPKDLNVTWENPFTDNAKCSFDICYWGLPKPAASGQGNTASIVV